MKRWSRKLHRWGALITFIPMLLVIVTGLLLLLKKDLAWIQPPTQKGIQTVPQLEFSRLLEISQGLPDVGVNDWDDIDRLDVRPSKGIIKVICKNNWEIQIDAADGAVLSLEYRRSDWIEALHDGSFFADWTKLWIFLPNGLILLGLWFTGVYLWWLPLGVRRQKRKKQRSNGMAAEKI